MPLPAEIREKLRRTSDTKVSLKQIDREHVVIEGKTSISFGSLVKLILKKKVQGLFREWNDEPIILSSDLLATIASAPTDSQENRRKIIMTALVLGACYGAFCTIAAVLILNLIGIDLQVTELMAGILVFLFLAVTVFAAVRIQARKMRQEIVEKVEIVADMFSK